MILIEQKLFWEVYKRLKISEVPFNEDFNMIQRNQLPKNVMKKGHKVLRNLRFIWQKVVCIGFKYSFNE